jgi:DNA-binding PadR family transcriptional regulator
MSGRPAPHWEVLEHLAVRTRTSNAGQVRGALTALHEAGSVETFRVLGVQTWALTPKGKRRLTRVRHVADLLPESPQHQAWRRARTAAGEAIGGFREALLATLAEATAALDAPDVPSDEWFALQHRLERDADRLGAATYCLYEWDEPDDARADVDDRTSPSDAAFAQRERNHRQVRRGARRNILRWHDAQDDS